MKKAFTMLELVVVIVVFGIVASIGADIFAALYKNYLRTRAINRLQTQVEISLEQISKLFTYSIKDSIRVKQSAGVAWLPLTDPNAHSNLYNQFEWIGISNDSFLGNWNGTMVTPGWSGLVDLDNLDTNRSTKKLITPGSNLTIAHNIIFSITDGNISMTTASATDKPAVFFKNPKEGYNVNNYFTSTTAGYGYPVARSNDTTLEFASNLPAEINEHYYLSHTAYALIPSGAEHDFNLSLHYNYQPWLGEEFNSPTTQIALVAQNVSAFKMMQDGDTIRIKLCIHDNNQGSDFNFGACKEKVVF